jgi:3-hydroxyacyl-[acyl-carrier-protein] dehydratase
VATGQKDKGLKNVTMSEDFLDYHFPKNPVMPGVLLLEALTQLAGWLTATSSDFENWFLLQKVHRCMFYGFAFPGDTVEMIVQVKARGASGAQSFDGVCALNGKKIVTAEFGGEVVPLADLEDVEEQREFFRVLTRSKFQDGR